MRAAPSFWWQAKRNPIAWMLAPVAGVYGLVAAARMKRLPRLHASVPVLCVGNLVVGGAGKTPTALALARIARASDLRPGFLTRGYGGAAAEATLVDAENHLPEEVGDEALLLAAVAPTVVSRDRPAGAQLLIENDVNFIIMDDGFQNPALAKDMSIVVVDSETGVGNGLVIPAGPLRAPLQTQLRLANALVVVGDGVGADPLVRAAARAGRIVLRAHLKPVRVRHWRKTPILAYAGIGRPEKFFATLVDVQAPVAKTMAFADHHRYTEAEAERLIAHSEAAGLRLVTTEKDLARMRGAGGPVGRLRDRSTAFAISLAFDNSVAVTEMVGEVARNAGTA